MLGGIGAQIAAKVRKTLGYGTRYENLGLLQRCFAEAQSELDRWEVVDLGRAGAETLMAGTSGVMVGLTR